MNLTEILIHHADHFGAEAALEYEGAETTWAELLDRTRSTAGALRDLGVAPGDVVAVLLHNSDRFIEVMHAVAHLGAIFVPLNWRLAGPELAYIVQDATARVVISEAELAPGLDAVRSELTCTFAAVGSPTPSAWEDLDAITATTTPEHSAIPRDGRDLLRLMYTSGTTSRPKGVMLTHGNLFAKCAAHIVEYRMTREAAGLACGPLYHVGTLDMTTTNLMYLGARTHIHRRFDARRVLETIEDRLVTHVWLAPAMVRAVLDDPSIGERNLDSVEMIIDGGEKMPLPLIERVLAAFPNAWFADAYGLTETMSGDTCLDKGRERHKLGSVGKPVLHTEIRVVDGHGTPVGAGEQGEIVIRGPKTCAGYWRNEAATAESFRDGWFHSGDLGMIDEDGYLFVVDRLKDVIISGGENVASSEVERVVHTHPAVSETAVVARPDERWNEVPVAYVALVADMSASAEELRVHCRSQLAEFKVPKEFYIVDELPRNPSGKVLKRQLRDDARQRAEATRNIATMSPREGS